MTPFNKILFTMSVFERVSKGWKLGLQCMRIILDHPKMLIFPLLSGIAIIGVMMTYVFGFIISTGFLEGINGFASSTSASMSTLDLILLFVFYFVSFFVTIFFNVALVYNARRVFHGEEVDIMGGMKYAANRLTIILGWAALAASVGTVLKTLEDNLGFVGKIIIGLLGMAWSILTYFVVPVLAFEDLGPVDALKRSTQIIKEKWGASLGAGFSFAAFYIIGIFAAIVGGILIGMLNVWMGIIFGLGVFLLMFPAISAARNVFQTAIYEHTTGATPLQFEADTLDSVFYQKKK